MGARRCRSVALALVAALAGCGQPTDAPVDASYQVMDVGVLRPGDCCSMAVAVNASGEVAGNSWAYEFGQGHAFRWAAGVLTDLGSPGGDTTHAADINAAGDIVGWTVDGMGRRVPFVWRAGVMTAIDVLAYCASYGNCGAAVAISDSGHVLLVLPPAPDDYRGRVAVWRGGTLTLLPATVVSPVDINASGEVLGLDESYRPVRWSGGVPTPLGGWFQPVALNDAGDVLGTGWPGPVLWRGGVPRALRTLGGYSASARGLSPGGRVAGSANSEAGTLQAVVWEDDVPHALALPPGMVGAEAMAVNDGGYAAGFGFGRTVGYQAFTRAAIWRRAP